MNVDHGTEVLGRDAADTNDGSDSDESCFELPAVRLGGIRLSEKAQAASMRLLSRLFVGATRHQMHLTSESPEDIVAFAVDGISKGAETYGELLPGGVADMLWSIGAKPGDRFYDLGSGAGKIVAQAWMAGLRATGVELSRIRFEASCQAMDALKCLAATRRFIFSANASKDLPKRVPEGLDFLCANAFNLDFTDADVVFVSSVMFSEEMMETFAATARWMKPGSLIVSYLSFPGEEFAEIGDFQGPTTWYDSTLWRVQEVVRNPPEAERPRHLKRSHEFDDACRCSFREEEVFNALAEQERELSQHLREQQDAELRVQQWLDDNDISCLHDASTVEEVNGLLAADVRVAVQLNSKGLSPLHSIIIASPCTAVVNDIFKVFQALVPEALLLEDLTTHFTPFLTLPEGNRGDLEPQGWTALAKCLEVPADVFDAVAAADAWLQRCPLEMLRGARLSDHLFAGCSPQKCGHDTIGQHRLQSIVGKAIVVALQLAGRGYDARFDEWLRSLLAFTSGPNVTAFDPRMPYRKELSETICVLQVATTTRLTLAMQKLYEEDECAYSWLRRYAFTRVRESFPSMKNPANCKGNSADGDELAIVRVKKFAEAVLKRCGIPVATGSNFLASRRVKTNTIPESLPKSLHPILNGIEVVILVDAVPEMRRLLETAVSLNFNVNQMSLVNVFNGFSYEISDPMSGDRQLKLWLLVSTASTTSVVEVQIHLNALYQEVKVQSLLDKCIHASFDHHHLIAVWLKVARDARSRVQKSLQQSASERIHAAVDSKDTDAILSAYVFGLLCCATADTLSLAWRAYVRLLEERYGTDHLQDSETMRGELIEIVLGT